VCIVGGVPRSPVLKEIWRGGWKTSEHIAKATYVFSSRYSSVSVFFPSSLDRSG
jgi:hypothetical protein